MGTAPFLRPLEVRARDGDPNLHLLCHWDAGASRSTIAYATAKRLGAGTPTPLAHPLHIQGCAGQVTRVTEHIVLRVRIHASLPFGEESFLLLPGDAPTLLSASYLSHNDIAGVLDLAQGTWTVGPTEARLVLTRDPSLGGPQGPQVLPLTPTVVAHASMPTATATDTTIEVDLHALATQAHPHRVPLTAAQLQRLQDVLSTHRRAFLGKNETNTLPLVEEGDVKYTCDLLQPGKPAQFTCRNRQQPVHLLPAIRTHLNDLLAKGKISVAGPNCATTSWASFHAKTKAEGTLTSVRMTIDYRQANKLIRGDAYPLPLSATLLHHVAQYPVYIVADLGEGYYNVLCDDPATQALMAFKTGDGCLYRWHTMPQGAKNSPGIFQAAMEHILQDLLDLGTVRVYLDDLIVVGHTVDDTLDTWCEVLTRFGRRGMRFKYSKLQLLVHTAEILGRIVTHNTIRPHPDTISGIAQFAKPTSVPHLRSFLGLVNWVRPHLPNLARTLSPLYALTGTVAPAPGRTKRQNVPFIWTPDCDRAFEAAKHLANKAVGLAVFHPAHETISMHDASHDGAGALLLQRPDRTAPWTVVAVWSHRFDGPQSRWTVTEQEEYALVHPLTRKWGHWTGAVHITAFTDHQAAVHLPTKDVTQITGREARWVEALSRLNVTIKHIPGHLNVLADALSRNVAPPTRLLVVVDLFAGIGTSLRALDQSLPPDVIIAYTAVECDETARNIIMRIARRIQKETPGRLHSLDLFTLGHDCKEVTPDHIRPLLTGHASLTVASPPCQPFSRASSNPLGLRDTREGFSTLMRLHGVTDFFAYECVVFSPTLLNDQATVDAVFGISTTAAMGTWGPQHRPRQIWTNLPWPKPPLDSPPWVWCLEPGWVPLHPADKAPTLMPRDDSHTANAALLHDGKGTLRPMNVVERERLVGICAHDTALDGTSERQRKQYLGNAHCVHFQRALYQSISGFFRIEPVRYMVPVHASTIEDTPALLHLYHQLAGHQGPTKTYNLLKLAGAQVSSVTVKAFCDACPVCARGKSHKGHLQMASLQGVPAELVAKPMDSIHMDFLDFGPCPQDPTVEGVLTIIDAHSRYTWLIPCTGKHETAASTIARVEELFRDLPPMRRIITDNGPQFQREWTQHWTARGVSTHHTAVGNPKGNGLAERANRTATSVIRLLLLDGGHRKWTSDIPAAHRAINWTTHDATGFTPHELFYGVTPNVTPQVVRGLHLQEQRSDANTRSARRHAQNVLRTTPTTSTAQAGVGDTVLIETGGKTLDDKPKLQAYYSGPHPVVKSTGATVTVDTGPKQVTLPRDRIFKPPTPLRDGAILYLARHWGSIPPTYISTTGGAASQREETSDTCTLALPELGITGHNYRQVQDYKRTAYGQQAPICLNNYRANTASTRKGHARPSVYNYTARDLVGLAAIALTPTLAGLITDTDTDIDTLIVTDTTGSTHSVTLAFAQANLLGIPATKNWGNIATSRRGRNLPSHCLHILGSPDWTWLEYPSTISRGADEAGTLNPKPWDRDLLYRETLPRDILHHGEREAASTPGIASATPGSHTGPVWGPL